MNLTTQSIVLMIVVFGAIASATVELVGQDQPAAQETSCVTCHGLSDLWEGDQRRLYVTPEHLADDVHWQKNLR